MSALLLDGRQFAQELKGELQAEIAAFKQERGIVPQLVVVQVQGDSASERYVRSIRKLCDNLDMSFRLELLPADVPQSVLNETIATVSADASAHGVLIQMPLPGHLSADQAVMHLDYRKDVDGVHPINVGLLAQGRAALVPNTPAGGMALLKRYGIDLRGKRAAVVGRSAVVGRPMALLLLRADATVTVCHSRTPNLAAVLHECDLVAVAAGRAGLVTGDMLRPGAVVVDFGINVRDDGQIVGDVDFASAVEVAGAITPVPGGTGPVTNVMLLRNVLTAARG
ncbi:MAG: bifunctional 5,10-methylenetetrahydrofolate dehydrogenase/5,10-methenyltetrahydrofolate cyclohydrolase [Chloroflexaceae bacterium]|jgi:methylenetetrahydrofolate dehydrogenase (NADP+)/methenyltetrahydrofolate cyclohydrolase|nr:bifunctional 5,10-methylenetetrahydrofolate dehydrogenase/5,10-methenyltetrahydrofolate cyclohydrolase [Chloroflexaceae bacterium]